MSALAEVTGASPVIARYYQTLLKGLKGNQRDELVSLAYLLIGTGGVADREAAFLCVDWSARVFAPHILEKLNTRTAQTLAHALRRLSKVTSEEHAQDAMLLIPTSSIVEKHPYYSARDACWNLIAPINDAHIPQAAQRTAEAASESKDYRGSVQLFRALCDLPRH